MRFRQLVDRRQRKRDDSAAVCADRKMFKRQLLLVRRQSVFDEGTELVSVRMLPGLEELAHS